MDKIIEEGSLIGEGNGIRSGVAEEVDPTGTTPGLGN